MQAIAFTGLPRSGKDTAADYLVKKHGFSKVVMSDENGFELKKHGLKDNKMGRSRMGKELREKFGLDVIARRSFERAKKSGFERVVFVGVRGVEEVNFFKKEIPEFKLIKIESVKGKRFERKSKIDGQSKEQFFEREVWEEEKFGLGKVLNEANYTIENNSTIAEFQKAIDELMQNI